MKLSENNLNSQKSQVVYAAKDTSIYQSKPFAPFVFWHFPRVGRGRKGAMAERASEGKAPEFEPPMVTAASAVAELLIARAVLTGSGWNG